MASLSLLLPAAGISAQAGTPPAPTTNPYVVFTDPVDGETGVSPDANIFVEFSDPMNTSSVTWWIVPAIALTAEWYPGNFSVNLTHTTPFPDCTSFTIRVNGTDSAGDSLVPGPVPNPWTFTVGCPNPYIVFTDPLDGETNVALSASIVVVFSETMDTATVIWTLTPSFSPLTPTWNPTSTILTLGHTVPFTECTQYAVTISGTDAGGNPLVPGPVPNPWSFTTGCLSPYITATSPANGMVGVALTANITASFSKSMNTSSVTVTIAPTIALTPSWDTPRDTILTLSHAALFAACTQYTLTVSGSDDQGYPLVPGPVPNPWSFATICPGPYIVSTVPAAGAINASTTADIVVAFSDSMNTSTVTWVLTPDPGTMTPSWDSPTDTILTLSHTPLMACAQYTVTISGKDKQGNPLVPGPVPNPWSFTTDCGSAPFVSLSTPNGGERWTGGSQHYIWWNMTDAQSPNTALTVTIAYSMDSGSTYPNTIVSGRPGTPNPNRYLWTVPTIDTDTARVQVCATDPAALTGCDESNADFSIDSTPPQLTSHTPADDTMDVPTTAALTATFSEAMDRAKTEASFWISPSTVVASKTWSPGSTTLTIQPVALRSGTRHTWGFSCSATDASSPGNPLADCLEIHNFTTALMVTLSLTSPAGGESWTGGSVHPVTFALVNSGTATQTFNVSAEYRRPAGRGPIGAQTILVLLGTTFRGQFSWTVPLMDATDVVVNLTAVNTANLALWAESGPFEIDSTAPRITSYSPSGPQAPIDPVVTVAFSEPMSPPQFDPFAVMWPQGAPPVTWTLTWAPSRLSLTAALSGTLPCTTYNASVGASLVPEATLYDDSDPGNLFMPFLWSFTTVCLPTVDLSAPNGAEDWTGGSLHTIRWTSADRDDATLRVTLSYSLDGGADGFPHTIASNLVVAVGTGTYLWTLPKVDSARVLVRIRVADAAGNTAVDASAAAFTVDSTPPSLLVSFPSDGATGHKTTREIWFVWTEPVDRASFAAAFSLVPNPGGVALSWSVSNLGGDVVLVSHDSFKSKTTYTVTFAVTARDDSSPGNTLAATVVVRFSTQPPPPVNPPVALAVGQHQVEVGVPVTFDGTGSSGSIRDYVWRVVDNQGRFVAVLVGSKPTYTFQQQGRYSVTLTVTDVNGVSDDDTVEIAVTSNPHSTGLILAGGALLVAALIGSTEAGRLAAFSFILVPLYARRKKDELAEQETRGMIRGYIIGNPGDSYSDIKRHLELTNGVLLYHLHILEQEGIVRSQARGSKKLFYPRDVRLPDNGGGMHEVQIRMLRAVRAIPGLAVTDIAGALGVTSQLALYHLRVLATRGAIRFERRGLRLRCYPESIPSGPVASKE